MILPNQNEATYSDLMGLKLICNSVDRNDSTIVPVDVAEAPAPEEIELTIDTPADKKSNFDLFVMLREQGYTLKQIHEGKLLPLAYNSLKNYNCKYNKLQTV